MSSFDESEGSPYLSASEDELRQEAGEKHKKKKTLRERIGGLWEASTQKVNAKFVVRAFKKYRSDIEESVLTSVVAPLSDVLVGRLSGDAEIGDERQAIRQSVAAHLVSMVEAALEAGKLPALHAALKESQQLPGGYEELASVRGLATSLRGKLGGFVGVGGQREAGAEGGEQEVQASEEPVAAGGATGDINALSVVRELRAATSQVKVRSFLHDAREKILEKIENMGLLETDCENGQLKADCDGQVVVVRGLVEGAWQALLDGFSSEVAIVEKYAQDDVVAQQGGALADETEFQSSSVSSSPSMGSLKVAAIDVIVTRFLVARTSGELLTTVVTVLKSDSPAAEFVRRMWAPAQGVGRSAGCVEQLRPALFGPAGATSPSFEVLVAALAKALLRLVRGSTSLGDADVSLAKLPEEASPSLLGKIRSTLTTAPDWSQISEEDLNQNARELARELLFVALGSTAGADQALGAVVSALFSTLDDDADVHFSLITEPGAFAYQALVQLLNQHQQLKHQKGKAAAVAEAAAAAALVAGDGLGPTIEEVDDDAVPGVQKSADFPDEERRSALSFLLDAILHVRPISNSSPTSTPAGGNPTGHDEIEIRGNRGYPGGAASSSSTSAAPATPVIAVVGSPVIAALARLLRPIFLAAQRAAHEDVVAIQSQVDAEDRERKRDERRVRRGREALCMGADHVLVVLCDQSHIGRGSSVICSCERWFLVDVVDG